MRRELKDIQASAQRVITDLELQRADLQLPERHAEVSRELDIISIDLDTLIQQKDAIPRGADRDAKEHLWQRIRSKRQHKVNKSNEKNMLESQAQVKMNDLKD